MSKAIDLFHSVSMQSRMSPENSSAIKTLQQSAEAFEFEGNYFSAGYTYSTIVMSLMGRHVNTYPYINKADECYDKCLSNPHNHVLEKIACLKKKINVLSEYSWMFRHTEKEMLDIKTEQTKLASQIETIISKEFSGTPDAGKYLVHGFQINTNLDGKWWQTFTNWETDADSEQFGGGTITINIASAFTLRVALVDYAGANEIADKYPDFFISPGLKGWKEAVKGFCFPEQADFYFEKASTIFNSDNKPPEVLSNHGGHWSSKNWELWGTYFRSRAELALARKDKVHVREHIFRASEIIGKETLHWIDEGVSRYRILVKALAILLSDNSEISLSEVRKMFEYETYLSHASHYDHLIDEFISGTNYALDNFRKHPEREFTEGNLARALTAFDKIPIMDSGLVDAIRPRLEERAHDAIFGVHKTWIARTLETISDEDVLRKVVLKLVQASLPIYAQIIHGPTELGTDIVALVKIDEVLILKQYQVKCGNITKAKWPGIKEQLEEIFDVKDRPSLPENSKNAKKIGILIYNGHPNPITSPVINSWFEVQKTERDRQYEHIHLDAFVNWIIEDKLLTEFRQVLTQLNVPITE